MVFIFNGRPENSHVGITDRLYFRSLETDDQIIYPLEKAIKKPYQQVSGNTFRQPCKPGNIRKKNGAIVGTGQEFPSMLDFIGNHFGKGILQQAIRPFLQNDILPDQFFQQPLLDAVILNRRHRIKIIQDNLIC